MSSSQPAESSRRRQPRQDDRDELQVAPYLTHVVAHHGQLTLIPPQNAGRIRKPTKKKKQAASRDRDRLLDDDEPRFTTAVPPSSSRKLHPAPAQVRTRKHALSTPTSPSPGSSSRRYDPIIDDHSIPDYPPPSFEDAIASPHVPPHLSSPAGSSQGVLEPPTQTQTQVQQTQQPLTPSLLSVPVPSSADHAQTQTQLQQPLALTPSLPPVPVPVPSSAASSRMFYQSPAVSQVSLARSVDPHFIPPSPHTRHLHPAPSPLAFSSTSTLPSTVVTESTAFSDTPLLRPPQPRSVPHSSRGQPSPARQAREALPLLLEQVAPQRRERSQIPLDDQFAPEPRPAAAPYRLTSPSTTTLLSSTHAVRDAHAVSPSPPTSAPAVRLLPTASPASSSAATSQVSLPRSTQLPLPLESSPPSSPYPQSRTSVATASDVFEEFTWDPRQRWSADRRLGFSLEERVQREFERRNTEEALTALGGGSSGSPVDNHTRRCSHCGSLRPLECNDIQSIDEASDEELEDDDTSSSRGPPPVKGKSPYLHPAPSHSKATFMSRSRSQLLFKSHSPEPSSSPTSPMSPSTTSFFKNPSAWASTVTLSLTNALHNHGERANSAPAAGTKSIKRECGRAWWKWEERRPRVWCGHGGEWHRSRTSVAQYASAMVGRGQRLRRLSAERE